jgi:hypothetical protein
MAYLMTSLADPHDVKLPAIVRMVRPQRKRPPWHHTEILDRATAPFTRIRAHEFAAPKGALYGCVRCMMMHPPTVTTAVR